MTRAVSSASVSTYDRLDKHFVVPSRLQSACRRFTLVGSADSSDKQLNSYGNNLVRFFTTLVVCLLALSPDASALSADEGTLPALTETPPAAPPAQLLLPAQQGCMSLNQAISSVRRQGNVKQIISADTRVSGGREVHHIKFLTNDGRVRTRQIPGCRR